MTKADYLSTDALLIALVNKRSELTTLIKFNKSESLSIKMICDMNQMSTATYYRVRGKTYVNDKSWNKMIRMLCQTVGTEIFMEYILSYYELYNRVFTDAPSIACVS